ncbi:putative Ntn-hydrolase superfamily protein [Angulomicrobium tetraedrale]|uniref:Putative Ntn-hydrolase superfamily protein n=1 Tax=Ancylobacter tetraedralis TaxID=217068 RepID=A0A839Z3W6_9HYPH|nr:putative Ntn-hydrolase superfamily protein [Ancylobacter tetraedralis]
MTFSISARCAATGRFGIAVSSSSPAVAARCAHARAGIGVVSTQNITDPTLGPKGLDLLASGLSPDEVLARFAQEAPFFDYRQVVVLGRQGPAAGHSGAKTLGTHAIAHGRDVAAAGNLLASTDVPAAMVAAFEALPEADLGDRLVAAMQAGVAAGGEAGPVHSAGLLIVDTVAWPVADLRIDWSEGDVMAELAALWALWKPQMDAYVTRALDPTTAPSYGVPGDR